MWHIWGTASSQCGCDKGYCNRELIREETEATIGVYIIVLMPCAVFTPDSSMKSILGDGSKEH